LGSGNDIIRTAGLRVGYNTRKNGYLISASTGIPVITDEGVQYVGFSSQITIPNRLATSLIGSIASSFLAAIKSLLSNLPALNGESYDFDMSAMDKIDAEFPSAYADLVEVPGDSSSSFEDDDAPVTQG
jgi:hypothetical protein